MVGFNVERGTLEKREIAFAGASSGVFTRTIIQPLDVVKIRLQLQVEPLKRTSSSKYYSVRQTMSSIMREERVVALWKGHIPAQILSVIYGVTQFVSFETFTKIVGDYLPEKLSTDLQPITHFFCGAASGCVATVSCQPFDVIRTRLIAQGEPKVYPTMTKAALQIVQHEGPKALYKGLLPALIAIGPQSGFQFGFYTSLTNLWKFATRADRGSHPGPLESLVCGSAAGICAKVAVYPLDLTKKRLQVQGRSFAEGRKSFGRTDVYNGWIHCLRRIRQVEGFAGLYKGLSASLLKAAVSSACIFTFYEQFCAIILYTKHR